jgi:hypothetical protein
MARPRSAEPEQEVVGRWRIEDMMNGDTGLTIEIEPNGTCRISNGVEGTWEIEDDQLVIKAVPFAAFFVTPGGDQMMGAWMLIEGQRGALSSVALHRVQS